MPRESQNNCNNLIPKGDVLLSRSFVRLSLFKTTIGDITEEESKDFHMPVTMALDLAIGIPIHQLSQATISPFNYYSRGSGTKKVQFSLDRTFIPKSNRTIPKKVEVQRLSPKSLLKLSKEEVKAVESNGSFLKSNARKSTLYLSPTNRNKTTFSFASGGGLYSQTLVPQDIDIAIALFNGWYTGKMGEFIEVMLSDPRSGEFHNGGQAEKATQYLSEQVYEGLLDYAKTLPEWNDYFSKAPMIEWPQFLIGIATQYEQEFRLEGYQRGRLIESVTLGPEEELITEIFSWEKTSFSQEDQREITFQAELESEVSNTLTSELSMETNQELNVGVSGNLGGSMPTKYINIDFGITPDVQSAMSTSANSTIESINEATKRSSEKLKQRYQVSTKTTRESGLESRITRKFINPNRGRTLNLHHFETLAKYKVLTKVNEHPQLILEVENPAFEQFDRDWVRAHSGFLFNVLKHDIYKDGIKAAQILAANDWLRNFAAAEKSVLEAQKREMERQGSGVHEEENTTASPKRSIYAIADRIYDKLKIMTRLDPLSNAIGTIGEHFTNGVSVQKLRDAEQSIARAAWWSQFTQAYPPLFELAKKFVQDYHAQQLFKSNLNKQQKASVVKLVGMITEPLEDDWLVALKTIGTGVMRSLIIGAAGYIPIVSIPVVSYAFKLLLFPDDAGLGKALSEARMQYQMFAQKAHADELAEPLANPPSESVSPQQFIPPPPRAFSDKELAEADAAFTRLRLHLEAHSVHYTNEYYLREDPAERLFRLDQLGVANYVENRILGFSGTKAIYPLRLESFEPKEKEALMALLPDYKKLNQAQEEKSYTITIPTAGITTETILGECSALEPYLTELRELDLEERRLRNLALRQRLESSGSSTSSSDSGTPT